MTQSNAMDNIKKLFVSQKLGVLATAGDPYPYTSLMTFASSEDMRSIIFATLRNTTKYSNMQDNECVSLLVDSSMNEAADLSHAVAVTVLGKVEESASERQATCRELLLKKHPELESFLNDPDCALMLLAVDTYVYVDRFQNVQEFKI